MAHFIRGTGSDLTPMKHSLNIFHEYLRMNPYSGRMGKKGSGKIIIVDSSEFEGRQAGDTARFHFIPQNKTDGIYGQNADIEGNEDNLDEYFMDLKIDQVAKAFAKKGKMTTKRMIWDFRSEAKQQLVKWFADKHAYWISMALTGYISDGYVFVSNPRTAQVVEGEGRLIVAVGGTASKVLVDTFSSEADLLADYDGVGGKLARTDKMNTYLLDELEILAKQGNPKYRVRPVRAESNGVEYFVLDLSLSAFRDLRTDPRFEKRMISLADSGVDVKTDAFAKGAIGVWNNIIVFKNEFIYEFKSDDGADRYARNLLMGADAMVMGYAQTSDYTEELRDHKRKISVSTDEISGRRKINFDGVDLNVIQVVTASN
jgi:hypothetical protein